METILQQKFDGNYTSAQFDGNYTLENLYGQFDGNYMFFKLMGKDGGYQSIFSKYWCEQASSAAQVCKEINEA